MNEPVGTRFTLDGSPELEAHLSRVCARVRAGVQEIVPAGELEGILLGGGYGRGEGGVLRGRAGDEPYNDLEFYVLAKGNAILAERRYAPELHELGHRLTPSAGLEVEFKVMTLAKLRQSAPSMFYYDLVTGHRWLQGDDSLLVGCGVHRDASQIPLHEATRLLMNRSSGLLYSKERLLRPEFGLEESDFVGRNLAKARLALGDVVLAAQGLYHWSCRERHARLSQLTPGIAWPWLKALQDHHSLGLDFKLYPERSQATREMLRPQHQELVQLAGQVWLWLENRRLQSHFANLRDYALTSDSLCPETSPLRNRLIRIKAFGPSALLAPAADRYPREALFRSLCLLLFADVPPLAPEDLKRVQTWLRTDTQEFASLVGAYRQIWERFN